MGTKSLAKKIKQVAQLSGSFTLRSGEVSSTYFDKYRFESDPQILLEIVQQMQPMIPEGTEVLCGMEMGGIPIATMLSQVSGIPASFIRKEAKTYGTCNYAEGTELTDKKILIVEDVVSSGGAIIDGVNKMREDGVQVDKAICVIDRRKVGANALADNGISLDALFTMADLEDA